MSKIPVGGDIDPTMTEYYSPVTRGILGLFICTTSLARAARNLRFGDTPVPDATIVGEVEMDDNNIGIACKSLSNYLQTVIPERETMSGIFIVKTGDTLADDAHRPIFWGTRTSGPRDEDVLAVTFGIAARISSAGAVRISAGYADETGGSVDNDEEKSIAAAYTDIETYTAFAWKVSNAGVTIRNLSEDGAWAPLTAPTAGKVRFVSREPLRIGSGYSALSGTSETFWDQFHDVLLTDDEFDLIYEDAKAYWESRGFGAAPF